MTRDYRDLIGGVLLLLLGGGVVVYGTLSYDMGTIRQMGPGMFPVALGCVVLLLGVAIVAGGWSREGDAIEIHGRALIAILSSIVAFGVLVESTGIVPASIAAIVIAMFAERGNSPLAIGATTVSLLVVCYVVFELILKLRIPLVKWPL